jgi:hypothetical protein
MVAKPNPKRRPRTSVDLEPETLKVLRAVSYKRGGRVSVAKVIADLIDENLDKLRKEAGPLLK